MGYHAGVLLRFVILALPLLLLILALFGALVGVADLEPRTGAVARLAVFDDTATVAPRVVIGTWLMEAAGLVALFLLAQGRCGAWWLDGLVAGWLAWVFRGPLLVITIVIATGQPQGPWWALAFGWWWLYGACGLALAILARRGRRVDRPAAAGPPVPAPAAEHRDGPEAEVVVDVEADAEDGERVD